MKRYYPSIKRYSWVLLVCAVLATLVGIVLSKTQSIYQASTIIEVNVGPSDGFLPTMATNDAIAEASDYSSLMLTRGVMTWIYSQPKYADIKNRGYGPDDLLVDITTSASATAPLITITATTKNPDDTAALANDVTNGFNDYIAAQNDAKLQAQIKQWNTTLNGPNGLIAQQKAQQAALAALPSSQDPRYPPALSDLNNTISSIHTVQGFLYGVPAHEGSGMTVVHLVTPQDAAPPNKPIIIIGITVVVGLLIGFLALLLVVFLDNRVVTEEQIKEKLGLAYLGSLARDNEIANAPTQARGPVTHELADIGANLRLTGVLPSQWRAPQGVVLLVTSIVSTEGKTSVASALAAAMARGGCSTLIMDGNLRRPATHLTFGMSPSGVGLSGLLKAGGSIDEAVKTSPVPGVWMLPGGAPVDDPTLLLGQRLPNILTQLRKKADLIIIDGPALLSGADASVLASMADGVMLIADGRHSRVPTLMRAKEILSGLTRAPIGIMLNFFARRGANHYYASAYPRANDAKAAPASSNGQGVNAESGSLATPARFSNTPPAGMSVLPNGMANGQPMPPPMPAPMPVSMPVAAPMPAPMPVAVPKPAPAPMPQPKPAPVAAPTPAPVGAQKPKNSLLGYSNSNHPQQK